MTRRRSILSRIRRPSRYDCWDWAGGVNGAGRPIVRVPARWRLGPIYVYRYIAELVYGPAPTGYDWSHLCDNKRCCNPLHLQAVPAAPHRRLTLWR